MWHGAGTHPTTAIRACWVLPAATGPGGVGLQNQRFSRRVARRGEPIPKGGPLHDLLFSYAPEGTRFLDRRRFQLASEVDSLERCRAPSVAGSIGSQSPITYSPLAIRRGTVRSWMTGRRSLLA